MKVIAYVVVTRQSAAMGGEEFRVRGVYFSKGSAERCRTRFSNKGWNTWIQEQPTVLPREQA